MKKWFYLKRVKSLNGFIYETSNVFNCTEEEVPKHSTELPIPNHSGHSGNAVVYELTANGEKIRRKDLEELANSYTTAAA